MALQELDLTIQHRSRKHNANADTLSCHPMPESANGVEGGEGTGSDSRALEKEVIAENSSEELLVEGELPDIHPDNQTTIEEADSRLLLGQS